MAFKLKSSISCCLVIIFLLAECSSSSPFISDSIFEYHGSGGATRTLLQIKTSCPVDFEHQNYTIITGQCKGPQFPANICCTAFKEFACPFGKYLNDASTDCSTMMLSYIQRYGSYPPGLFSSQCRDDKEGLDCSTVRVPSPSPSANNTVDNSGLRHSSTSKKLMLTGCFLLLLRM